MIIVAKKNDDFKEKLSTLYISQKGGWSFGAAGQAGIELGQIKPAKMRAVGINAVRFSHTLLGPL